MDAPPPVPTIRAPLTKLRDEMILEAGIVAIARRHFFWKTSLATPTAVTALGQPA